MASPCEILVETDDERLAAQITDIATREAKRIETRFSRYRTDNLIHRINAGETLNVDGETARLLDYAAHLHRLSGGLFDITAGVLRRAWRFDGSDRIPEQSHIEALLPLIGWQHVDWDRPRITLPEGMEIDLGGIGKEYAVDCAIGLIRQYLSTHGETASVLINFGGDIAVTSARRDGHGWRIGIDTGIGVSPEAMFKLGGGAIATSGDTRHYLEKDGTRYGHVLDPYTGWPIAGAPASVTVTATTCTDAGMLSTLALLYGTQAEAFLRAQEVQYWCQW